MAEQTYISEVFSSVQGEGKYIGYRQVFIRLAGCIFDCPYCDTDFSAKEAVYLGNRVVSNPISADMLSEIVFEEFDSQSIHSYSFTGGEPLLAPDFIEECAVSLKNISGKKIFLETSGLITSPISRFDGIADIMSVDVKTHSSKVVDNLDTLLKTLTNLKFSEYYLKLLLPHNLHDNILHKVCAALVSYGIGEIIVQPVDNIINEQVLDKLFELFYKNNVVARVIPQSHKLLGLR